MYKYTQALSILFLVVSAIILVAFQIKPSGWLVLLLGAIITLFFCEKKFRKDIILLYISVGILSITPISTDIGPQHFLIMGIYLFLTLGIPYYISNYIYKNGVVHYSFHHGRNWYKTEILYIGGLVFITYLLFPFMLRDTGSYLNWTVKPTIGYLIPFFLGLNLIGAWDEFFFMSTVLVVLQKHLRFVSANLAQSVIFTSFLYVLGFRGWATLAIFIFAFMQGRIYKRTNSLFYLIAIHLAADFVLFLVLIHAYYPSMVPIFLIK